MIMVVINTNKRLGYHEPRLAQSIGVNTMADGSMRIFRLAMDLACDCRGHGKYALTDARAHLEHVGGDGQTV